MRPGIDRKQSIVIINELKRRSGKSLDLAKKAILTEKIEYERLRAALEYYVTNWCDFTHSGVLSLACETVGGEPDSALSVQAAAAMMAAAFDIQDDIIDQSTSKHGLPTVFGKYGECIAILLANAFLVDGFTMLHESVASLPRKEAKQVFENLKQALSEVGNAHALELDLKKKIDAEPEQYLRIFEMKAASIEADMRIGAIVGNGTCKEIEALGSFGRVLGVLTQLREEFADVFEIEEFNHRLRKEYLPLPVLLAMQEKESRDRIGPLLRRGDVGIKDSSTIVDVVFQAASVEKLQERMKELVDRSIRLLARTRKCKSKKILIDLATSMLEDL
jgi:geranylgeranyl pyrophosphate synthase